MGKRLCRKSKIYYSTMKAQVGTHFAMVFVLITGLAACWGTSKGIVLGYDNRLWVYNKEVLPIFRTTDCCFLVCFLSSLRTWERKEPVGRLKLSGSPRDLSFSRPVHIRLPDDINQSVSFV
jgi:hypothetical protein